MAQISEKMKDINDRLDNDLEFYCRHMLKIRIKEGPLKAFIWNKAQRYLHKRIEEQRARLGRVRVIIVKGRQQGCSTYIEGRGYKRATRVGNTNVFILAHVGETSQLLYDMAETFHENIPMAVRPKMDVGNRKTMKFKSVNATYRVGTAGSEDVGRGGTVQFLHGSEVASWEKVDNIDTGILESVSEADETEIYLESTAKGMGNDFFKKTREALKRKSDYIVIFIPWYWQEEYARDIPSDGRMQITEEDEEFREFIRKQPGEFAFELSDAQLYWRRSKIKSLGDEWKFKQEYPSYLMEAFQTSGKTFISDKHIMDARVSNVTDTVAPLIMGVDPARTGDRTVFAYRRGRQFLDHEVFEFDDNDEAIEMQIAGLIIQRIKKKNIDMVFIDTGSGWGVIDRLKELGWGHMVKGIGFQTKAIDETYANKRAEIWSLLKLFIEKEEGEVSIPDSDEVQTDLSCMPKEKTTSSGRIQMVSKDKIREDNSGMSPDIGDAMALTFSFPVRIRNSDLQNRQRYRKKEVQRKSSLTSVNRARRFGSTKRG